MSNFYALKSFLHNLKSLRRYLVPLFTLFIFLYFFYPLTIHATTLNNQSIATASQSSTGTGVTQQLGNGLTGVWNYLTVRFAVNNTAVSNTYSMQVAHCDNSLYTTNCVADATSDVIADESAGNGLSASDYTYNFSSSITLDSSKYYYFTIAPLEVSNYNKLVIYGSSSDVFSGGVALDNSSTPLVTVLDLYFLTDTYSSSNPLRVVTPPDFARTFSLNFNIPVDGTCPENGTDKIVLSWPNEEYESESFDCTSNQFSISIPARDYGTYSPVLTSECFLPDENPDCQTVFTYTVDPNFFDYFLTINYPRNSSNGIDFVLEASNNFPFRYVYRIPSNVATSTVDFYLQEYTNGLFATTTGASFNASVSSLGITAPGQPAIEDNHVISDGTKRYWKAWLQTDDDVIQAWKIFTTISGSNGETAILPTLIDPDGTFCGSGFVGDLCRVFWPPPGYFLTRWNQFSTNLQNKLPFYFYFELKDTFSSFNSSTTEYSFNFPLVLGNATVTPIAISTSDNSLFQTLKSYLYPIMEYLLWIGFGFYLFRLGLSFRP